MYHRRNQLKSRNFGQSQFCIHIVVTVMIDAVLNVVQVVDLMVDLQVAVLLTVDGDNAVKSALGNNAC